MALLRLHTAAYRDKHASFIDLHLVLATSKIGHFGPLIVRYVLVINPSPKIQLCLDRLPKEVLTICLGSERYKVLTTRDTHMVVLLYLCDVCAVMRDGQKLTECVSLRRD